MSVPAFVDTNVLVCADDRANPEKRERARALIREVLRQHNGRHRRTNPLEFYTGAHHQPPGV